jgi:3-oxoacyl-[acyl-carrier protein] reductase
MTQAVVEIMKEQKFGRIINFSSPAFNGKFGQSNYAAVKGAINSLTRCTAVEYARHGVTANAICPGFIDTPLTRTLPTELYERLTQLIPAKVPGQISDITGCALFLAGEEARYITGQIIFVDGGITLGQ